MSMAISSNMKINSERLWDSIMEMAKIGPGVAGGNNRQTLTDEDAVGRNYSRNGVTMLAAPWVLMLWGPCLRVVKVLTLVRCLCMLEVTSTHSQPVVSTTVS